MKFVQLNADSPKAVSNPIGYHMAPNGCWLWVGAKTGKHAQLWMNGKVVKAGRWLYEDAHGKLPKGQPLAPTCDSPTCVNPDHRKPSSYRALMSGPQAERSKSSTCKNGHPFSGANLRLRPTKWGMKRECLTCTLDCLRRNKERYNANRRAR